MVFYILDNILNALADLCYQRNKPIQKPLSKVNMIIQDMEDLAVEEIEKILKYHNRKQCC